MISQKRYIITVVLLIALSLGSFFSGINMGSKGYAFNPKSFNVVNRDNQTKTVDYSLLWQALEVLNNKYIDKPVDQQKVLYGAIQGAVAAVGDPYTSFFDPKQYSDFKTELGGSFDGIGAEVGIKDGSVVIVAPLDGSPAEKAGVLAGDILLKINDEDATTFTLEQAVSKIRGPKGTTVVITVYRPVTKKQIDFPITRAKIDVISVKYKTEVRNEKKIQIIEIDRFGDDTEELFRKAALDAQTKNVDGIILDLRDDPGGYLDGAVTISSYWIKQGDVVVSEKRSDGSSEDLKASGSNILGNIPTVVLINGGSASASEIVAGALHDHGKAKTVGTKSFGKGSVQELVNLPDSTALKVTVAKWYTPNGININKNGLEPDVKVERSPEELAAPKDVQKDSQMEKAFELLAK